MSLNKENQALLSKLMHYNDELTNDDRCDLFDLIETLTKARDEQCRQLTDRESRMSGYISKIETLQSQLKQAEIDAIEKLVKSIHPVMVSTTNVCTRYLNKLKEQD